MIRILITPVMQGKDNYEYLNKDPYGEFSLSGSIFLDARNDLDFEDDYSLIYGHHMEKGAMFGALDDFQDRAYFDQRRSGTIVTDERSLNCGCCRMLRKQMKQFCSIRKAARFRKYSLSERGRRSYITSRQKGNESLPSTCSGGTSIMRLLVFGTIHER